MSLKSFLALVDDKLHEIFERKAPDAAKARAKALKTIESAKRSFTATEPTRGRKAYKINNDVVAFTPGYKVDGRSTMLIPSSRFADALSALEKAINGGELDDALIAGGDIATSAGGVSRKPYVAKNPRGPLSPEKLAARRAKVAAKK